MSQNTSIEWTDCTWSPIRARVKQDAAEIAKAKGYTSLVNIASKMAGHVGQYCEHVSDGCLHCYSETNQHRCLPSDGTGLPFERRSRDLVDVFLDEKALERPLHWRKPKRIFVENQSDLFGEWVPDEMIDRVFAVGALCPQHTLQILTKRPERMRGYFQDERGRRGAIADAGTVISGDWPLPNVWLGVSCEDQATADKRIPLLLQTPAAVRFVSYEPALGPVDLAQYLQPFWNPQKGADSPPWLDWVIIGGESGPGARPFDIAWARQAIEQCKAADVACFMKQVGSKPILSREADGAFIPDYEYLFRDRKGGDMAEWPEDLRVREYPSIPR